MRHQLVDTSSYLLKLYAMSDSSDALAYAEHALDGLSRLVDADKAWWGVISMAEAGPQLCASFRSRLPSTWEPFWESVKCRDSVAKAIARQKNRPVSLDYTTTPEGEHQMREMAEEFDIREAVSVAVDIPDQNAFMFFSTYRRRGRNRFSASEKFLSELLAPHIFATWQRNVQRRLRKGGEEQPACLHRAFIDRECRLVECEDGFAACLSRNWRSWSGSLLPIAMQAAVAQSMRQEGQWVGEKSWLVRCVPAGLWNLVELREATAVDVLRPRELEVARIFSGGASHKEVARETGLTPATVRHYLREVYAKLGVDNKAALAHLMGRSDEWGQRLI